MISNVNIRPFMADSDTACLSDIWLRASKIAHPFIGEATLREQQPLMEDVYLPMASTWVAEVEGQAVGFLCLLKSHVAALFVDPAHQGRGIGRALLDHAAARHNVLSLEVYTHNAKAVAFYHRYGFTIESQRAADDQGQPFANARMVWVR